MYGYLPCPHCHEPRAERSRTRGLERFLKLFTVRRPYRCGACGWRGRCGLAARRTPRAGPALLRSSPPLDTPATLLSAIRVSLELPQCHSCERPVPAPFRPTRDYGHAGRRPCTRRDIATSTAARTDIITNACPRIVPFRTGDRSPEWHLVTSPFTADRMRTRAS